MTGELRAVCKKRTSPNAATSSDPTKEGDRRKRRRNRTTLSCLNCHISKRMCDRKRPCGRCTQLGLTGLCIYEVDDPSQRSDSRHESLRLRQRVADLEGVVRELKNRPHPRWVKSQSSPGDELEKPNTFSESLTTSRDSTRDSQQRPDQPQYSPSTANSNMDASKDSYESQTLELATLLSDSSSSDPSSLVPTAGYEPQFPVGMAGDQQLASDIDLASLFISCPDLLICDKGSGHADSMLQTTINSQHIGYCPKKCSHVHLLEGHCGCLNETVSYNVMLELSLRLRKAVGILSHSANHRFNTGMLGCPINQRIEELDTFATTVLGNITTSPNDIEPVHSYSRANTAALILPAFPPNGYMSTIHCAPTDIGTSANGSILNWEPSRQV